MNMSKHVVKKYKNIISTDKLYLDLRQMIEKTRITMASTVNYELTMLYWQIGKRINDEILKGERAAYGKEIVAMLSKHLVQDYGNGFSEKNLRRMLQFAKVFPDEQNVVSLIRHLSWTHFIVLIPIKNSLQREFYAEMCRLEKWGVRILRQKVDSMLYERTAISSKPEKIVKNEIARLRNENHISPDLVFRSPYVLDFLDLKDTYSEHDLEAAILRELESFLLELGAGFTFIARQKRMIIDSEDHYLDLLFFHRKLKRLVAIELKLGKFKAAYKGQMELYLRWLEKNETESGEKTPLGLILCAEGSKEIIELLQLNATGIHIAEYLMELPPKEILEKKLHAAIAHARAQLEHVEKQKG